MTVEIEREITSSVPDHQVLLSFTNDYDAVLFDDWWYEVGRDSFLAWLKSEGR